MQHDELMDEMDEVLGEPDPLAEVERLRYIGVPQPDPAMFYGRIGVWSEQACQRSEASRVAVYLSMVAYVGACLGRGPHFWLADTPHHPRISAVHVGRTGRGRKGTAVAPVERLHRELVRVDEVAAQLAEVNGSDAPTPFAPQLHVGGLSTREGLAWAIRDARFERDRETGELEEIDPGVPDKRLFIIESEFENVLQQGNRDGNTLSSALRDCFDGRTLAPLTKTNRTKATDPHVAMVAHVTPHELLALLKDRAVTNGFLNRFLLFWAERERFFAFPERTPDEDVRQWVHELREAVVWAREPRRMRLSANARETYERLYLKEWSVTHKVPVVAALLERAPVVALRIAMTLACLERQTEITPEHLACGAAWVRYWRASVEYVWKDRVRLGAVEGEQTKIEQSAKRILDFLRSMGNGEIGRSELRKRCFHGHIEAADLDAALEYLQLLTPPEISVREVTVPRKSAGHGTKTLISLLRTIAQERATSPARATAVVAQVAQVAQGRSGAQPTSKDLDHPDVHGEVI